MKITQPTASSRKYLALYAAKHKQLKAEVRADKKAARLAKKARAA